MKTEVWLLCGYTLTSVEKKYPQEERELAVLARYWSALKDLAQGQPVKVITKSQVHKYLRKGTVESTKATNARWGRWEDMLLDPELEIGPAQPPTKKQHPEPPEKGGHPETSHLHRWVKKRIRPDGILGVHPEA